jgi:hypothetical protein
MSLRLLIDECLSPDLVAMAVQGGDVESSCLRDRGLLGTKDWALMKYILAEDCTLVTANARDFRGGGGEQQRSGLYASTELNAGLVCLNPAPTPALAWQPGLFAVALEELADHPDLVNQVLEVTEQAGGDVVVDIYKLPATAP